jgi:phosphohistidine phosphatase
MCIISLLRHADSVHYAINDKERLLSEKGLLQAKALADFFEKESSYLPELILCSSAKRTRQTIDPILQKFKLQVFYLDELYGAQVDEIESLIAKQSCSQLMVVSHNPAISILARKFLTDAQSHILDDRLLSPSQMIIFKTENFSRIGNSAKQVKFHYESI